MENTLLDKLNEWAGTIAVDYTHKKFGIAYCFEYIVPKLPDYYITFSQRRDEAIEAYFQYYSVDSGNEYENFGATADTAALALCRAVEKLIDG